MKVGTDAVLLATIPAYKSPKRILDIGSGTGVISLMLAQQFPDSKIDAIEIDTDAYEQTTENFKASPWNENLKAFHHSFESQSFIHSYDLIISNPPYFKNSLKSGFPKKDQARHASDELLKNWLMKSKILLGESGIISFILPYDQLSSIRSIATEVELNIDRIINIQSFADSAPVRVILIFSSKIFSTQEENFIIYDRVNEYSQEYKNLLKGYLTIF
jgi:tRNA1Val (adenine37-N6)-methyltransferase